MKLVYIDREQLEYERHMQAERQRYIGEGRCYECDHIVDTAGGILAGMLICAECAEKWTADCERLEQEIQAAE